MLPSLFNARLGRVGRIVAARYLGFFPRFLTRLRGRCQVLSDSLHCEAIGSFDILCRWKLASGGSSGGSRKVGYLLRRMGVEAGWKVGVESVGTFWRHVWYYAALSVCRSYCMGKLILGLRDETATIAVLGYRLNSEVMVWIALGLMWRSCLRR